MNWYAVYEPDREDDGWGEARSHTVSNTPGEHGWTNDSGVDGYGLTRRQVDHIAGLSAEVEQYRAVVAELRESLPTLMPRPPHLAYIVKSVLDKLPKDAP